VDNLRIQAAIFRRSPFSLVKKIIMPVRSCPYNEVGDAPVNELVSLFAVLIAVFLFGMTVMRLGLESLSKKHIRTVLLKMTDTPLKSFLIGILLTAVIQSSSAVMVITVGLLAAGIIRFRQTIGIILGANIGTTVTLELFTLKLSDAVIPLLAIGAVLLFSRKQWLFSAGCVLFGLGTLFTALNGLGDLAEPLTHLKPVHQLLLVTNNNAIASTAVGALFTAIIQSSTATTGIAMAFINEGQLSIHTAIAIMLGANSGTCITALLASIGTNREAKLASYTHIALNVAGVALFLPFIHLLSEAAINLSAIPGTQVAHASVIFNVLCSLAALPFTNQIAGLFERMTIRPR
jgi:phosphate:Na+ symporter